MAKLSAEKYGRLKGKLLAEGRTDSEADKILALLGYKEAPLSPKELKGIEYGADQTKGLAVMRWLSTINKDSPEYKRLGFLATAYRSHWKKTVEITLPSGKVITAKDDDRSDDTLLASWAHTLPSTRVMLVEAYNTSTAYAPTKDYLATTDISLPASRGGMGA